MWPAILSNLPFHIPNLECIRDDTIQERIEKVDLDFSIIMSIIQFHINNHDSQSNYWIGWKVCPIFSGIFFYIEVNFKLIRFINALRYRSEQANRLYKFCCLLFFWFVDFLFDNDLFFYKDVTACFENFLVPQGSLMSCNIVPKCGNDSLMFQNPFLTRIPYSS